MTKFEINLSVSVWLFEFEDWILFVILVIGI
jgi:hypothetical protein